jgi:hypothetical protein
MLLPCPAQSASFSVGGVTFSDKLGGFVLERVTGHGSVDDPFVVVERMTNPEGGTLLFRADPAFGNRIGSIGQIGFALVKVVENTTGHPWTSFELELQSKLGIPSDDLDELSFGQGSTAGRPFTASSFSLATIVDEPFDRIEYENGNIPAGGRVALRLVISQPASLHEAYLAQRPGRPVANGTVSGRSRANVERSSGEVQTLVCGQNRSHVVSFATIAAIASTLLPFAACAASLTVSSVTFSDELGGFVLERVTGEGSLDDPIVITERTTDINGGTLAFRVSPTFGNEIGTQHSIGFAMVKIVENGTDFPWTSLEIELQSTLGTPSDYGDGLSFGQGSSAGRPFTATGFDQITLIDERHDRIEYDQGKVPVGSNATFRFAISETLPLKEAYLTQRPRRPVAEEIGAPGAARLGSLPEVGNRFSHRG